MSISDMTYGPKHPFFDSLQPDLIAHVFSGEMVYVSAFNYVQNGHDLFKDQNTTELMCAHSGLTMQMHACAMTMLDKCLSLCDAVFKKRLDRRGERFRR
mmetsp:Transcript_35198/g.56858  ORF Transcript_35198/g.56858 Transcript_35198/m.56858 type:complete len:99 (-) Transcript_35198:1395-1691(-)